MTAAHSDAPRTALRSNSFNYAPDGRDLEWVRGAACPLLGAADRGERGRTVYLRLARRLRRYATQTSDFGDAEIALTVLERGQLYADVSRKLFPDDFARDLKKLLPDRACAGCPERAACPGAWIAEPGEPFSRDDAVLRAHLASLTGDVLDVGAGEGPYLADLEPAVRSGRVRYVGVEPEVGRVALLAERLPGGRFVASTLADALQDLETQEFDHVLLLRSYNHLPDVDAALRALVARLRPGGSLVLADNVAFGLVREAREARRAEAGPAEFEHFRNDSSHEASRLAAVQRLHLELHRPVGAGTSNQWLLCYRKP